MGEKLNKQMSEIQMMTIEEASAFLNLKVSKLRRDVFMKAIPYYKFGSLIRFKKEELLNWVEEKMVSATNMNNLRPQM
jgi:excisionase family DNA binding protein